VKYILNTLLRKGDIIMAPRDVRISSEGDKPQNTSSTKTSTDWTRAAFNRNEEKKKQEAAYMDRVITMEGHATKYTKSDSSSERVGEPSESRDTSFITTMIVTQGIKWPQRPLIDIRQSDFTLKSSKPDFHSPPVKTSGGRWEAMQANFRKMHNRPLIS
jgi:hypothetical protein